MASLSWKNWKLAPRERLLKWIGNDNLGCIDKQARLPLSPVVHLAQPKINFSKQLRLLGKILNFFSSGRHERHGRQGS